LALFCGQVLFAGEVRRTPLDLCLIVDGSTLTGPAKEEALAWLSRGVVEEILQEGDRVTVWRAGGTAEVIFSETLGDEGKAAMKERLMVLETDESARPDFLGALKEAAGQDRRKGHIDLTLLVCGPPASLVSLGGAGISLIRYSKVENFKGWRILVVASGIERQVKEAAAAFMSEDG